MGRGTQIILRQDPSVQVGPPQIDHVDPPDHLSPVAAELWADLMPELTAVGMLTTHDLLGYGQLCEAYSDWCGARLELASNGGKMYYTDGKGIMRVHPAHHALSDADRRLKEWCKEFALTPSVRLRFLTKTAPKMAGQITEEDVVDLSGLSPDEREALRTLAEKRSIEALEKSEDA